MKMLNKLLQVSGIVLCFSLGVNLGIAQVPVSQGLLAYYPLNGDAQDLSGHRNHGNLRGGVSRTQDRHGQSCGALAFDGSSAYISVPHSPSLGQITDKLTLSVWVKINGAGLHGLSWLTLVCKGQGSLESYTNPHYRVQLTSVTLSINTDMTENVDLYWRYGQWYHIVVIYDSRNAMLFQDGQRIATIPYNTRFQANSFPLNIGRDEPGVDEFFYGALDDVRIYNRALSIREIEDLFQDSYGAQVPIPQGCQSPPPANPTTTPVQEITTEEVPEETPSPVVTPNPTPSQEIEVAPSPTPIPSNTPHVDPVAAPTLPFDVQDTIVVSSPNITITLYDDRKKDGDIVSVAFNGIWLVEQEKLVSPDARFRKPPSFNVTLRPNEPNYLVSKAWNEGDIPPNTLAVEIRDPNQRRPTKHIIHSNPMKDGAIQIVYRP